MFESALKQKLTRIFDLDKVTFDLPSESQEQECLFIDVQSSKNHIKDGVEVARVTGKLRVFSNSDKLKYGYFSKRIAEADSEDVKDLFFFDFEENSGTFRNITERSLGFVFLFSGQYDPEVGTIDEITIYDQVGE